MKLTIDTLVYQNALRSVSPFWKFGLGIVLILLSILSHPIVQFAIFIWMMVWTLWYARIPRKPYLILLGTSLLFYLISMPALLIEIEHSIQVSKDSIFSLHIFNWTFYVTKQGFILAYSIFFRSLASISCLLFILFTIPFLEILQVMKRLKMPQIMLELTLVMYRFIFLLVDTAYGMAVAQHARGGHVTFLNKVRDISLIVVHLFQRTMYRYRGVSHGLISRGFTEDIILPPMQKKSVSLWLKLESIIVSCLLIMFEVWIRWG
jgi:cobalt/nickel transport system permease protein